jgi:hypothetical protein
VTPLRFVTASLRMTFPLVRDSAQDDISHGLDWLRLLAVYTCIEFDYATIGHIHFLDSRDHSYGEERCAALHDCLGGVWE